MTESQKLVSSKNIADKALSENVVLMVIPEKKQQLLKPVRDHS